MSKARFKNILRSKLTYIFLLAVVFGLISISALRSNYMNMVELRNAVNTADKENGDVEKALQDLRSHVYSHMNTNLATGNSAIKPPIQLKYRYERLQAKAGETVKVVNARVSVEGERICGAQFPSGGFNPNRVKCIQDYVAVYAVTENSVPDDLYKFDFISPKWSADLAGISLVITAILSIVFVVGVVKAQIKKRYF